MDTATDNTTTSLALINCFYALSVLLFLYLKIIIHKITLQIRFPVYTAADDHPHNLRGDAESPFSRVNYIKS